MTLYKHKGTKTILENLIVSFGAQYTERIYPDSLNANFVTIMGQVPQILTFLLLLLKVGLDLRGGCSANCNCAFYYCSLALYWFNHHDLMDGVRARR